MYQHSISIKKLQDQSVLENWIQANIKGNWSAIESMNNALYLYESGRKKTLRNTIVYFFEEPRDALIFKLAWS